MCAPVHITCHNACVLHTVCCCVLICDTHCRQFDLRFTVIHDRFDHDKHKVCLSCVDQSVCYQDHIAEEKY